MSRAQLWAIDTGLNSLQTQINNLAFSAEDISYTHAQFTMVSDVDDALDYIYNNFYHPGNIPVAGEIPCTAIGAAANNKVQLALDYLNNEVNSILSSMPCQVGAGDVTYNSPQGATNVADALTYVMGFISHMINNEGISYSDFSPA